MKNLSIEKFAGMTASGNAVPGGGSVSALCGSLSAALAEMVANLTIGNKKYPNVQEKLVSVKENASVLQKELLDYIEKDSAAYMMVMNAYKLPKTNEKEKAGRREAIQMGLKQAARIPMEIAERACRVMELSEMVVIHGNKNAVTDGIVSAMLARTSALGALMNVKINLSEIKDNEFVSEMNEKANRIQEKCMKKEKYILSSTGL